MVCVAVAQPIPAGKSQLTATLNGTPIPVYTYRPTNYTSGPLFVVFHGMLRNADAYRDSAVVLGDTFDALIAAPEFDTNRFPSETYQRGGVFRKDKLQPKEKWTYSLIPKLVEELRCREGRPDLPYFYIGHSAGGQFLVRMTAFLPTEVQRIVAVNAGAHIFPTRDLPFPYGFGGLPPELGDDHAIKRFLAQPLTLYQGTADVLEAELDMKPDAMKQGPTRIERGRANFRLAQQLAAERGWPFNWRIVEAPGLGHNSKAMFSHPNCAEALFGPKPAPSP
jgi:poly(3-hydroxybutyrate) depolymerase